MYINTDVENNIPYQFCTILIHVLFREAQVAQKVPGPAPHDMVYTRSLIYMADAEKPSPCCSDSVCS